MVMEMNEGGQESLQGGAREPPQVGTKGQTIFALGCRGKNEKLKQ